MRMATTILLLLIIACRQPSGNITELQKKIDSLQQRVNNTYKPGFGEFMYSIQVHHAKLWFAGLNKNWPLADFEMHEIQESLDNIKEFCADRPETKLLNMMQPALDSVSNTIKQQDADGFKHNFIALTATCNKCHQTAEHGFNIVIIPAAPPVSNQDFKPSH